VSGLAGCRDSSHHRRLFRLAYQPDTPRRLPPPLFIRTHAVNRRGVAWRRLGIGWSPATLRASSSDAPTPTNWWSENESQRTAQLHESGFIEGIQSTGPEIPFSKRAEAVSSAERVPARRGVWEHRNQTVAGVTC